MPISLEDHTSPGIRQSRRELEAVTLERPLRMPGASGGTEAEGLAGLASSSSTPMGRPVTYSRICYWELHRDWRDGAGSRCPSCYAGSPPSLRVRGVDFGAFGANERCVPSTPSYHHTVVFRGGSIGTTSHNHEDQGSERRLGRREGYMACCSGSRASIARSRRGAQVAHGSV